jgi:translation initiation factor 1
MPIMPGLFAGTSLERPVTCERCEQPLESCRCPRDSAGSILLPGQQAVTVRMEKRGKGKVMTIAAGFDAAATDVPAVLKKLKAACGAGGTAENGTVCVQGDHREKIAVALRELGYSCKVR